MGARGWLIGAGAVLVAAAGAAAALGYGGQVREAPAAGPRPPKTVAVQRTNLSSTDTAAGTLGYGTATTLRAPNGHGTLTWLPAEGAVVSRGRPAYRVDDRPVPLLYGTLPLYRTLQAGVSGADVRELERNLQRLGYRGFTVDDDFTWATAAAVERWQGDLGLDRTGVVGIDQVALAPHAIRVAQHRATPGSPAAGPLYDRTGTSRVVTVDLDTAKQQVARVGARATVTLPDQSTVAGRITEVGTVVGGDSSSGQGGGGQDATPTLPLTISIGDQQKLGTLDGAPVDVTVVAQTHRNVLVVPVGALVALAEGGYGVQVVHGSTVRYVPVHTGMFAAGRVEISGSGVAAGTRVGVAS
ncbi:peptidoglycan-binding protein [Actinocatenispora thailandica]|uniref:Peptidoglycan-binding protein n=1 Tax=Actinocatenispora thailandica TaxID=227318 RepID=A0A7R7DVR6_9ACTN|nr:peptidoglycan-binding protein [Actinocatenispora thailandica]BCJ38787.1 peptidoglycan-binding protein [Actinocatenispora thailandica]